MSSPPVGAVKRREIPVPVGGEVFGYEPVQFIVDRRYDDAQPATGPQILHDVAQVQVAGPEIVVGVEAHDRIEVFGCEFQIVGPCVNRHDPVGHTGLSNALPVGSGADPQVCGDDVDVEFPGEKNRAGRHPTPQVQDAHTRL